MLGHRKEEIDTTCFRSFLKQAAQAFDKNLGKMTSSIEDVMPWKVNGERWHLGEKGFPAGRKLKWDRALLPQLLALVREVEPGLEVTWDTRDAITLRVPGVSRGWATWRTKDADGLVCRFLGKKGALNLSQFDGIGAEQEINGERSEGETLVLIFRRVEDV